MLLSTGVFITACDRDEDHDHNNELTEFDYRISINSPSTEDKYFEDSIHLHIDFISDKGATVHHVNVKIYDKLSGDEVYNAPEEAHVHEQNGIYSWHDDFELTQANGIKEGGDYIIDAKVWGHTAELEEVVASIEFHVQPN